MRYGCLSGKHQTSLNALRFTFYVLRFTPRRSPTNIVNVGYRSTNYYVLADTTPRLLVDAGWPGTLSMLQHTCNQKGIKLASIPYQLVTHYHPDHAGLAEDLKRLGVR